MGTQLLQEITHTSTLQFAGNKAQQLQKLIQLKMKVPKAWVIGSNVLEQHISGIDVKPALLSELSQKLDLSQAYAVRSSSNVEDSFNFSYAGLFKTILNVKGADDIIYAVESIWQSAKSIEMRAYTEKMNLADQELKMAVIIQEMIDPVISGVLFSQNPMTGSKEFVIEAVPGLGTQLVQDGITPERFVNKSGGWIAKPDKSAIPLQVIEDVLAAVQPVVKKLHRPLDFEWVFDGKQIFWVQMREITTINPVTLYSNRFSKDMMPGMIHPLIWSINIPLINTMWLRLLEEMVGKMGIEAQDLAKSFYYRSYFNMGTIGKVFNKVGFPSEGLEMMMGMLPQQKGRPVFRPSLKSIALAPRLLKFFHSKWYFEKRLSKDLPVIEESIARFDLNQITAAPAEQVLAQIDKLYTIVQKAVYPNIVTPILASMLTRVLEKQLLKSGYKLSDVDLTQRLTDTEKYNPAQSLPAMHAAFEELGAEEQQLLNDSDLAVLRNNPSFDHFFKLFDAFIERFGHLSENSNNFMAVPWREQPEMVLDLVRNYSNNAPQQIPTLSLSQLKTSGIKKGMMRFLFKRVRTYNLYREKVSRIYTYGYGLFRPHFLRLASLMQEKGWLEEPNQIFYLSWQEIKNAISSDCGDGLKAAAQNRQREMQSYENIKLPDVIYGDEAPPVFSTILSRLAGTPTSPGYYSGPIKLINGFKDFSKVLPGDVVVIPYSDIGWTPIFSKAGAVIAESGGMLSHSSIIAREYKIPAVVSVSNALSLKDNMIVNVNGYTGEIVILD